MFDTIRESAYKLGIDIGLAPDWLLALIIILAAILLLRVLASIADSFIRIGCMVIMVAIILYVLLQLF
jgi:hypothetical protein